MVNGVSGRRNTQRPYALDAAERALPSSACETKAIVVVIDRRVLFRDCLARCFRMANPKHDVLTFSSVAEWREAAANHPPAAVIVFCNPGLKNADAETARDIVLLSRDGADVPLVVISDAEDVNHVLGALDSGARGYIPTSVTLDVAVGALHVVQAGGTFVPANSLVASKRSPEPAAEENTRSCRIFTVRQAAVAEALRQGKPNKQIAYELNMCESTVKLHVRNIMRKLKVKNRTEAAILTSSLRNDHADRDER